MMSKAELIILGPGKWEVRDGDYILRSDGYIVPARMKLSDPTAASDPPSAPVADPQPAKA